MIKNRLIIVETGVIVGLLAMAIILPGGLDAWSYFFRDRFVSVPPYVNMVMKSIAWIPWPWSYAILNALTVVSVLIGLKTWKTNWWWVLVSMPVIWELWGGQVDFLVILGIALGWKIANDEIDIKWIGVATLLMLVKVWIGIAPLLYIFWLVWKKHQFKPIKFIVLSGLIVIAALFVVYGKGWVNTYIGNVINEGKGNLALSDNGALPLGVGLIGWALVPLGKKGNLETLTRIVAAGLLMSPYITFYHMIILIVMIADNLTQAVMLLTGWIAYIIPGGLRFAWLLPVEVLVIGTLIRFRSESKSARPAIP